MQYYAVKCRHCGRHAGKQVRQGGAIHLSTFKCPYCHKTGLIKHKKECGLHNEIHGPVPAREIAATVAKLNASRKECHIAKEGVI